jgi:hypothetical protein
MDRGHSREFREHAAEVQALFGQLLVDQASCSASAKMRHAIGDD